MAKKYNLEQLKELFVIDFTSINWKDLRLKGKKKQNLLIVEDERSFRELLQEIFDVNGGYNIDLAENGKEGLEKYKQKKHEIVMTDIMMDYLTGVEMADAIRKIEPDQKVFFFSGWVSEHQLYEKFEDEFRRGNFQFIAKPFDMDYFQNHVYLFTNDELKNVRMDTLNKENVEEILHILTPYQLVALHTSIWDLCVHLFEELLNKQFDRKDLTSLMVPTSDYKYSVGCTYDDAYCRANICMASSPTCASNKLKGQIYVMLTVLGKIYNHYVESNLKNA